MEINEEGEIVGKKETKLKYKPPRISAVLSKV